MNRILSTILNSLFATVNAKKGALGSSLGVVLGLLPLYGARIPLIVAMSLLFRLNILAILLGMIIVIFIPFFRSISFLLSQTFEGHAQSLESIKFWLFSTNHHVFSLPVYSFLGRFVTGMVFAVVLFPVFFFFYNWGIKASHVEEKAIFVDSTRRRWKIIRRMIIGFLSLTILVSISFFESLYFNPAFPDLQLTKSREASSIKPVTEKINEQRLIKQLKLEEKLHPPVQIDFQNHILPKKHATASNQEIYGFYVNWDENSKASLKKNIHSLSVLVPEWLQLHPDLSVKNSTDQAVVDIARNHNVKITPLVNNYYNNDWNSEAVHTLVTNPENENTFIQNMKELVLKNHFSGINIDFENINQADQSNFTKFLGLLADQFHQSGLEVTVDVPADDSDYEYAAIAKSVDRMIVMAYDEHSGDSQPGPVASAAWVKQSLENLDVPSDKLVVSLGSYGYDWTEHSSDPADPVTFGDLMDMAGNTHLDVHWDKETGNPYLRYQSDGDQHIIWFLDGATFYNQMKIAIDNGSKGIAIWRLGSEDPSIWKLINHPKDPAPALKSLVSPAPVHYTGEGEVLKIVSTAKDGSRSTQTDKNGLVSNESYNQFPKPFEVVRYGKPKNKEVVLTFDDGPDPVYTPQILDILDRYHIKASFFIVGENAEVEPGLIERMFNAGDEIGNHTFTHPDVASVSPIRTKMELNANQRLFQEITGHSMTMFRPPYVADAEPSSPNELLPIIRAQKMGYTMIGELIDPEDWERPGTDVIVNRVLKQLPNGNVILLHDAGGDRSQTVAALPKIIETLQKQGYTFTTIGHLIGKKSADIMPSAQKDSPYRVYDKAVFNLVKGWRDGLTMIFYSAIVLGIIRLAILVFLSRRQVKRYKEIPFDPDFTPLVSVVIAAFNEEKVICQTIDSILNNDYPAFEMIVVDDGSKDRTSQVVEESYKQNSRVRLLKKANGGKSSAINYGIQAAKGEIIVALDADTIIAANAISLLVRHFKDETVAAVSGNVKVGNKRNLLTNWQHIEYVTGFNLERRSFAQLNCITVVPGAIGAWRKTAIEQAGYFKEDTLAEDTDLTLSLLDLGFKIEFEEKAYAYTEAPEDIKSLSKQRYRWTYGTLQCLWKHKGALFNRSHKTLGFIGLPNMWMYQYFYQLVSPIADLLFVLALFGHYPLQAAAGFVFFFLIDLLASLYAFRLEKESPKPLLSLFLQRILYKQLMTYVVFKSILSAFKGGTVGWNKLKRNGNVNKKLHTR